MIPAPHYLPVDEDRPSDSRIVLLDDAAAAIWAQKWITQKCLRCRPDNWSEATEWQRRLIGSKVRLADFAAWAASRLSLTHLDVLRVSPPLYENFAHRLSNGVAEPERAAARLCAEVLGWIKPTEVDFHERWAALAQVLSPQVMPPVILDARKQFALGLDQADQIAVAETAIGLRVETVQWRQFLSSENWDRNATRWRLATVLSGNAISDNGGQKTTNWVKKHLPDALPLLDRTRAALAAEAKAGPSPENEARSAAEAFLFSILNHRPFTRNRFHLNVPLDFHFGTRPAEADLAATDVRLVIEVDGYYHFRVQEAYRRDRRKDAALQEHGWFVLRFLAEDVVRDVQSVVEQIEYVLARRDAVRVP